VPAQGLSDNLSVHGFLTQGYATSSDLPIYGIPTDGTVDYRSAALQFRYALSASDNVVLQIRNRRLGTSALTAAEDDVQLQWAFYQRRIGKGSVRVGKVPLSLGLYNETRNVGTVVPFYRAPASFYMDGVETLDGANARYPLTFGAWEFEAQASAGSFDIRIPTFNPQTGAQMIMDIPIDWVYTAGGTLRTPVVGLSVSGMFQQFKAMDFMDPTAKIVSSVMVGSVDGTFNRFFVRGEIRDLDWGILGIQSYYGQAGIHVLPSVSLLTQYEVSTTETTTPMGVMSERSVQDIALGANYRLTPNVVFKLEGHRNKGFNYDRPVVGAAGKTTYVISSMSVSF
jgi:hypothetical protein